MPCPQFTLRALLVAMLVVAVFFAGMAIQLRLGRESDWPPPGRPTIRNAAKYRAQYEAAKAAYDRDTKE